MAELEVQIAGRPVFRVPLGLDEFVVGRGSGCGLQIVEPYISNRHTSLALKLEVKDLGSTNGTLIHGERVQHGYVNPGEAIQVGGPEGAKLTLFLHRGQPDSTVSFDPTGASPKKIARLEGELAVRAQQIETFEQRVATLEAELAEARAANEENSRSTVAQAPVAAESASDDGAHDDDRGDTVHLARIGELQEKLRREQKARRDAEAKIQVLSKSGFSGAQEAVVLVQERDRTIQRLQQDLDALRKQLDASGGRGGGDTVTIAAQFIDTFSNTGGLGLEDALQEMMSQRAEILPDLGFVFGTLYRFSRDLEGVITRMAQLYRGGVSTADETMIPGITANLSRSVHGLLLRGGQKPREDLQAYLESLRVWSGICLTAYKSGAKLWCRQTIQRISPDTIQRAARVSPWKRALGLDGWEFWRTYRKQMEDITVDIAEAQIDDLAATQAVELAKKQGVY